MLKTSCAWCRQPEKERKKTADQEEAAGGEDDHMEGMSETGIDEDDKPRARWKTWRFWKKILPITFSIIMFIAGMLLLVIGDRVVWPGSHTIYTSAFLKAS